MTPEAARALALRIWLHCKTGSDFDQELAGTMIIQALTAAYEKGRDDERQAHLDPLGH